MLDDLRFHAGAAAPGDRLRPVELPTVDGGTVRVGGERDRPMVLVTGSLTCPMTEVSMAAVADLYERYRDRIDFVLVSGREAHPGERLPQPASDADARARAALLAQHHRVPFRVVVDTIDGAVHRQLDSKPNTAVVVDANGVVRFRTLWASDIRALRNALDATDAGRVPERAESRSMIVPMSGALPGISAIVARGGQQARRDMRRGAPPMAAMAWVAGQLPWTGRAGGQAAMAVFMMVMIGAIALVAAVL